MFEVNTAILLVVSLIGLVAIGVHIAIALGMTSALGIFLVTGADWNAFQTVQSMLAATAYVSLLGKSGMQQVAETNFHKAHYAADQISAIPGFDLQYPDQEFFNEFTLACPMPANEINEALLAEGIVGGYDLSQDYPGLPNHLLMAVTEMNSREEIDFLVAALLEINNA